ncbi:hypothetical protein AAIB41_11550 [Brucella sp. BE17]|uniref:hypothetical protein n=1 Tax=Brucella sp. BE17 TaxID=3142977 RepID=UPI0031BBC591
MPLSFSAAYVKLPKGLRFAAMVIGIGGVLTSPVMSDGRYVRELDAYCVTADGIRSGVAASQDGATNFYVQRLGAEMEFTRSVHSRHTVSQWHAMLDRVGFNEMLSADIAAPYCGIERTEHGRVHKVIWAKGAVPEPLSDVFASMLAPSH